MKKILLSLLAIAAVFVSCKKEASVESESSKTITIAASCDDVTKTTYTDAGVFSWSSGDRISYIVKSSSTNKFNLYTYNTSSTGANASFSGNAPSGEWTAYNYAYYPNYDGGHSHASNQMYVPASTTLQATLAGTITAAEDRLSGIIPMIGVKTGTDASGTVDHYHFYPVTGVLKVSFTGLPATASQIRLTVPDAATYPLNGTFNIDTERVIPEIKANDVATGYDLKYLNFDYSGADDAFYFPIPTGTIPEGKLTVSVSDGTNILHSVICKQDIVLTRGEITELPIISVYPVTVSASGTSSAIIANLTFEAPTAKAKVVLAESVDAGKTLINNNDDAVQTLLGTGSTSALSASNISGSKKCYIVVRTYNSSDEPKGTVTIPVYSISDSDLAKYVTASPLTMTGGPANGTGKVSFSVSDDPTKGQLILKNFDGMTRVATETGLAQGHPFFTTMSNGSLYWMGGAGDNYYTYEAGKVVDGDAYYGIIEASSLVFNSYMAAENTDINYDTTGPAFFNYKVDGTNSARIFLSTTSKNFQSRFTFNISGSTLTATNVKLRFCGKYCTANGSASSSTPGTISESYAAKQYASSVTISLE